MKSPSNSSSEQSQDAITTLQNNKKSDPMQEYVSERVFKDKSMLCRIAIPYVLD